MHSLDQVLAPTIPERLARAQGDLRMGLPCLLSDGGASMVIAAVETLSPERFSALHRLYGAPELVLTVERAQAVMSPAAARDIGIGPVRIRPPEHADPAWFRHLADPGAEPGLGPVGPLHQIRTGETACHPLAVALVKAAELLPAAYLFDLGLKPAPAILMGSCLDARDGLAALRLNQGFSVTAGAHLPLEVHEHTQLKVFRDPVGRREHYAIQIGSPRVDQPVLTRLHSACFTGDVLGSLKCDCGPQLHAALDRMGQEGAGMLLYLNQEGRGIGLANKMRVYDLQSMGIDTVDANLRLGFKDDERDFRVAADMLRTLGYQSVRLLTNNPAKVETFRAAGIDIVEELPLRVGRNHHNDAYLQIKALKSGHLL